MKRKACVTIDDLSAESLAHVSSYLLGYSAITERIAQPHRAITMVSKAFRSSAQAVMNAFVHQATRGKWIGAPKILLQRAFEDGARLGIPGLTQKAAMECLVPKCVLDQLPRRTYSLARRRTAYSFSLESIFRALAAVYPSHVAWETALETRQAHLESGRLRREENLLVREARRREVRALWSVPMDERVENLYIKNGSAKNLEILKTLAERHRRLQTTGLPPTDKMAAAYLKTGEGFAGVEEWAHSKTARSRVTDELGRLGLRAALPRDLWYADEGPRWEALVPVIERASAARCRIGPLWGRILPMEHWCSVSDELRQYILHGTGDCACIDAVVESVSDLVEFRSVRRAKLVAALGAQGLELRGDSNFCTQYINGSTNACVEEVVATMWLTGWLFNEGGPRMWSASRFVCENAMRAAIKDGSAATWMDAARGSVAHAVENFYDSD